MRTWILTVALLLAGCTTPTTDRPAAQGNEPGDEADTAPNATDTGPLTLLLDADRETTQNETVTVAGEVDRRATVVIEDPNGTIASFEANGTWGRKVGLDFGRTLLQITADDGRRAANATFLGIRLAEVTLAVTFRGDVDLEDREDTVWIDVDSFPSRPMYAGCEQGHPGHHNVHDAMVAWTDQHDVDVTYGDCSEFGVSVEAIEGHESPGFWCYDRNGEAAEQGISLEPMDSGDTVAWDDCALVLG